MLMLVKLLYIEREMVRLINPDDNDHSYRQELNLRYEVLRKPLGRFHQYYSLNLLLLLLLKNATDIEKKEVWKTH
jgi:hypothetical protein